MTALYFGCWNSVGHFFYDVHGKDAGQKPHPNQEGVAPGRVRVTAVPTPWGYGVEKLAPNHRPPGGQGDALLHHKDGWTALAVDDFTIDSRGNSKSVFCFDEILTFDEAVQRALDEFPAIVRRIAPIRFGELRETPE